MTAAPKHRYTELSQYGKKKRSIKPIIKKTFTLFYFYLSSLRLELALHTFSLSSVGMFALGKQYKDELVYLIKAVPWKPDVEIVSAALRVLSLAT